MPRQPLAQHRAAGRVGDAREAFGDARAEAVAGAQIAFCPSSNLFLGSGLFGWQRAREAGVAKGTVFLYFASKEALFLDLLDRMLDEYYAARGWDADGVVKPETARAAGLAEIVAL